MTPPRSRIALLAVLLVVGVLSWAAREGVNRRLVLVGNPGWVTSDPDSLYHARRVERALNEGAVDGSDEYLNHPHGSPIPWPPYYTRLVASVLGPFAPEDAAERRSWVERKVASVPIVLGVLTTLLAALAGRALGGNLGAALAGCYHALCTASIAYSKSGNGDHHAWVSLLAGALLLGLTLALRGDVLASARRSAGAGLALGTLAGLLLGSWVGSLLYVIQVQLALAWLIFAHGREPRAGLATAGLAFHGAALVVVLPAVLSSPWAGEHPWMVVNLSWFHPAFLLVGGLVFAPLPMLRTGAARRAYPWVVAGVLALVGAALALVDAGPGRGIREGFDWVSRQNEFMAGVGESRPLVGAGRWSDLADALGFGVFLLPLVLAAMAYSALRSRWCALIPWIVSLPLLAVQAARQARFADALALPLAVALAWGVARLIEARSARLARLPVALLLATGLVLAGLANWSSSARVLAGWRTGETTAQGQEAPSVLGARTACDWLRARGPQHEGQGVLAIWSWGHLIEWAADRPTVATGFGSYVGEESFRDPCRFLMYEDPEPAAALLEERRARWVLVTSDLPSYLNLLIDAAVPELRERYVDAAAPLQRAVRPAWFRTMGARLLFEGSVFSPGRSAPEGELARPLDFLRLVHMSPLHDRRRELRGPGDYSPAAFLWERVPGARLEARGRPDEVLTVQIRVRFAKAKRGLTWKDSASADASGVARLRVPYATQGPNGDGWVPAGAATWSFGGREGPLVLSESAVRDGATVLVE